MTEQKELAEPASDGTPRGAGTSGFFAFVHRPVLAAFGILIALIAVMHSVWYVDYVGKDNDDVMRLVMVRDLLGGQGWFDLFQSRLGLEGGTLMHWSRLIDLPIAGLIAFFSLFLGQTNAEAAALFVWPVLTALLVFYATAAGARALAGPQHGKAASVIAVMAAFLFVLSINRFRPGAIDHHNVQLAIMATIAACLVQPGYRTSTFAFAGFLSAMAIAIGAETTPHIAVVCAVVAVLWLVRGHAVEKAVSAFSLSMALSLTGVFYLTIPPSRYTMVACDALSANFYVLGVVGAGGLFLAAALLSKRSTALRASGLSAIAAATGILAILIAPQCLGNPLANLDPLLVDMWLNSVTEAQPFFRQINVDPWTAAGFYAVPLIAIWFGVSKIRQRKAVEAHMIMMALIGVSYAIALVQVRGAVFSNLLSIFVMAPIVAELRARSNADPKNGRKGLAFIAAAFASVPFIWAFGGAMLSTGYHSYTGHPGNSIFADDADKPNCINAEAMAPLANEPTGVVVAASNLGSHILRFTKHRALSAPYHRNQGGMLADLKIGLAEPEDAIELLHQVGVTLVAFCASDPQAKSIATKAPGGLYAKLASGEVPDFLQPVAATSGKALQLFRVAR